ncbi:PREDICTED: protein qua-1-like isoform X1 [Lupinus angustifolius]|uniref:protein qua-1-like isoform X1 n=1 Tax=Lupinus angustifolius TaxID=3871 RepID=UPI00092E74C9|nr:PREDICTED: protein qua-1-like isoform X1 [Lupinus angustifolius]
MNLLIPNLQQQQLSFSKTLSQWHLFCNNNKISQSTLISKPTIIGMGGGPRTFPGGVSKWQWKRMQAKKAKQLLKARLSRERQIYEMRKRAELKAAVSELERPWELVQISPNLFSIAADEQVKVLADRFQKPGGFDMWSDKDGPQLFQTPDELPSARFFPKGVVHSIRPYRKVELDDDDDDDDGENGGSLGGEFSRIINERNFFTKGVDDGSDDGEFSSPLSYGRNEVSGDGRRSKSGYGRNEVNVDGGRSKNGNGRRFLPKGVKGPSGSDGGERSSPFNYERNGMSGDGRSRKNGNERRFMSEGVDDFNGEFSSPLNYERNRVNVNGRTRKNENGRRFMAKGVNDFDGEFSSPMNYGRNGNGRMRNNGDGRRFLSNDIDRPAGEFSSPMNYGGNGVNVNDRTTPNENRRRFMSKDDNRLDGSDNEKSSSPLKHRRNGMSGDGRMMRDENERRFMSKNIGGSNGLNTGKVGSGRKQRGSNSVRGKNYSRGTSGYASRRSRDADSEVYDMGLQQDGSYGFQ